MKSNLYHEKSIVVMSSRLNHSTPDLTMKNYLHRQFTLLLIFYEHFKINFVIRSIITSP